MCLFSFSLIVIIEDDVVLTNAEEEQLQRIINKMNTNANKITTMQNQLPDTVLLNTTPQTITGVLMLLFGFNDVFHRRLIIFAITCPSLV